MKNPTVNNIKFIGVVCCLLCFVIWPANITKLWRPTNSNQRRRLLEIQPDRSLQQIVIERKVKKNDTAVEKKEQGVVATSTTIGRIGTVPIDATYCDIIPKVHQRIRSVVDRRAVREYYDFYKREFDTFVNWPPLMSDEFIEFETITNKKHVYFQVHEIEERNMPHMSVFFDTKGYLSYPTYEKYDLWVKPNYTVLEDKTKIIELNERGVHYIAYISVFPGLYQHFLMDHLPMIAYLKSKFIDTNPTNQKVKLLLVDNIEGRASEILKTIDPQFEKNHVVWIPCDSVNSNCFSTTYHIDTRTKSFLTIMPYATHVKYRHPEMFNLIRKWLQTAFPYNNNPQSPEEKTVIYVSREGAPHGRAVDPSLKKYIFGSIRRYMEKYNHKEKFVVFNGLDPKNNSTMSVVDQIKLFRSATTIIGPHGGGVANILWAAPDYITGDCSKNSQRTKVLEFLIGRKATQVQKGYLYAKTWAYLYSLLPWVEYHHVFYTRKSTMKIVHINMEDFDDALEAMWGT